MPGPLIGLEKRGTAPRPSKWSGQTGEPVRQLPLLSFVRSSSSGLRKSTQRKTVPIRSRTATLSNSGALSWVLCRTKQQKERILGQELVSRRACRNLKLSARKKHVCPKAQSDTIDGPTFYKLVSQETPSLKDSERLAAAGVQSKEKTKLFSHTM